MSEEKKKIEETENKEPVADAAEEKVEKEEENTQKPDAEPEKKVVEKVEEEIAVEVVEKEKEKEVTEKVSENKPEDPDSKENKEEEIEDEEPLLLRDKAKTPDEFDWDAYENEEEEYSSEERAKLEALFDKTLSVVGEHEVVDGTVVFLSKREAIVNIGYKSEGVVSISELRYNPDLKVGDKIEVYVEMLEDHNGQLVLSHKKARALRSWDRVNEANDKNEIIKGYIKCRTKGGMIVDVFGIEAFLPGSQIDVKPIRDYDVFVGKTMEFKVVKINNEFKNVVVSHKALIEAELEIQKQEIISKLEKGQVLEGTVKNITSYGVFVDLGGVDGLIHITDLSWGRVNHPEEIVELDQKINVVILDFDDNKKRIALGLKQLTPHPWDSLDPNMKVGDVIKGKVVVMADYGAFIEIAPGVEGLIHVSEMSWSQHLRSAQEFLKVGDEVEAMILTLDREERKMSLGMKQLRPDPWSTVEEKYSVGTQHTARVRNFTGFGIFVEIEEGVDGLIHISDLSWTKKIKHPAEFCAVGDEIEVVVLEIDKDNRRLSLGHKQLEENPWDVFETLFNEGSVHEGTIVNLFDRGAVIALPYGVEGFATPRHLIKEDGTQAKIDEKLQFKVIEFNKSAKRIILSHSRIFEDERRAAEKAEKTIKQVSASRSAKKQKKNLESTTLGDISELATLKSQMEAAEQLDKQVVEKKAAKKEKKPEKTAAKATTPEEIVEPEAEKQKEPVKEEKEKVTEEKKTEKKKTATKKTAAKAKSTSETKEKASKTVKTTASKAKTAKAAKPAASKEKAKTEKEPKEAKKPAKKETKTKKETAVKKEKDETKTE